MLDVNDKCNNVDLDNSEINYLDDQSKYDEIIKKSGLTKTEFESIYNAKSDNYFNDIQEVIFYKNKENRLIGRLTNGKYVLPNKSEDVNNIEEGLPYICVLRHLEKVAFAKILSPTFIPKVFLLPDKILLMEKNPDNSPKRTTFDNTDKFIEYIKLAKIEKFMCIQRFNNKESGDKK